MQDKEDNPSAIRSARKETHSTLSAESSPPCTTCGHRYEQHGPWDHGAACHVCRCRKYAAPPQRGYQWVKEWRLTKAQLWLEVVMIGNPSITLLDQFIDLFTAARNDWLTEKAAAENAQRISAGGRGNNNQTAEGES